MLGLALTDTGFDRTVLTQFRDRVLAHGWRSMRELPK
ncbi:hypothetical protein [Streptomyces cellulosae]|uniref:Uncharacterized protein n=1 Tax=Streptomyces cellulosae TaxID=1968 RepID=A0ABW7YHJ2_STRCE